jgi:hypothetical protein
MTSLSDVASMDVSEWEASLTLAAIEQGWLGRSESWEAFSQLASSRVALVKARLTSVPALTMVRRPQPRSKQALAEASPQRVWGDSR